MWSEYDSMLSLNQRKISSLDIASGVKFWPGDVVERKIARVGQALSGFTTAIYISFWLVAFVMDVSSLGEMLISSRYVIFSMIIIGLLLVAYGSIAFMFKIKKQHILKINIDGKHTHIPFKVKADALKVFGILERYPN